MNQPLIVPPAVRALLDRAWAFGVGHETDEITAQLAIVATLQAVADWWEEVGTKRPVVQVVIMTDALRGVAKIIEQEIKR